MNLLSKIDNHYTSITPKKEQHIHLLLLPAGGTSLQEGGFRRGSSWRGLKAKEAGGGLIAAQSSVAIKAE
jgi:hypothetical protein